MQSPMQGLNKIQWVKQKKLLTSACHAQIHKYSPKNLLSNCNAKKKKKSLN